MPDRFGMPNCCPCTTFSRCPPCFNLLQPLHTTIHKTLCEYYWAYTGSTIVWVHDMRWWVDMRWWTIDESIRASTTKYIPSKLTALWLSTNHTRAHRNRIHLSQKQQTVLQVSWSAGHHNWTLACSNRLWVSQYCNRLNVCVCVSAVKCKPLSKRVVPPSHRWVTIRTHWFHLLLSASFNFHSHPTAHWAWIYCFLMSAGTKIEQFSSHLCLETHCTHCYLV